MDCAGPALAHLIVGFCPGPVDSLEIMSISMKMMRFRVMDAFSRDASGA